MRYRLYKEHSQSKINYIQLVKSFFYPVFRREVKLYFNFERHGVLENFPYHFFSCIFFILLFVYLPRNNKQFGIIFFAFTALLASPSPFFFFFFYSPTRILFIRSICFVHIIMLSVSKS